MRDGEGLQHQTAGLGEQLEFVEEPGLAHSRLTHHSHDLPVAALGQCQGFLQLPKLALTTDEPRQSAFSCHLELSPQRSYPEHFVDMNWFAYSFDLCRSQRFEL